MTTSRVRASGAVPPERFVAALTDFGARRGETFGNSDPGAFAVHGRGADWAEVTEGARGVWQRLRYDWSAPGVVRLDVLDGNAFGRGSSWEYRIAPDGRGGSTVALTVHRVPVSVPARLLDGLLWAFGPVYFGRDLRRTLARLRAGQPT